MERERLIQIIKILSEVYRNHTHLPSAKHAIFESRLAKEMTYRELKPLEIMIEDIEKGVDVLAD